MPYQIKDHKPPYSHKIPRNQNCSCEIEYEMEIMWLVINWGRGRGSTGEREGETVQTNLAGDGFRHRRQRTYATKEAVRDREIARTCVYR
jgi:hypothetical protein